MDGALREAFRHHAWATQQLLAFCRDLEPDQLAAATTGTYGDILETFDHLIRSDGNYLRRLSGNPPSFADLPRGGTLEELGGRAAEAERGWEASLAGPVDADRVLVVDDGAYEVRAGVIVAQALHHGNVHREQICAILTSLGLQPPDIQPWEYAWERGRIWERPTEE